MRRIPIVVGLAPPSPRLWRTGLPPDFATDRESTAGHHQPRGTAATDGSLPMPVRRQADLTTHHTNTASSLILHPTSLALRSSPSVVGLISHPSKIASAWARIRFLSFAGESTLASAPQPRIQRSISKRSASLTVYSMRPEPRSLISWVGCQVFS